MSSVKIKVPDNKYANLIAILCEDGKMQKFLNEEMVRIGADHTPLSSSALMAFDDDDNPDHYVELCTE